MMRIMFVTGAESPLEFFVNDSNFRGEPFPDGQRLTIIQDESDSFYGSNLTKDQVTQLWTFLGKLLFAWAIGEEE